MKKIVALLLMASFVTVNAAGAFAEARFFERGRGRVSGRVEHRNTDRRIDSRRSSPPVERRLSSRPAPNMRGFANRPARRDSYFFNRSRPMTRHHSNFFNRPRVFNRRPVAPLYRSRPYYSGHSHRSSSLSALEFFGISAAIISIAAAASHTCYDY
ncbi:MAG: hypothetical protein FWF87_01635 [Synergistaceae bacterium]|nr:hypothetical protein [Synergistaceae bacterium]